jgi:hypothetical protein
MKDFVVRTKDVVFGDFDTYAEAFALWRTIQKRNPDAVIQDNSP